MSIHDSKSSELVQLDSVRVKQQVFDDRVSRWKNMRPSIAHVYIENRCNLKCEHCYESEETHPPQRYALGLDDYNQIFEELHELGVLSVTLTGGEIFLRRDVLDIVALARRHRMAVTLFTSGTLIDRKKAERLANLQVQAVEISLYSHDADVHDAFTRTPGSHARSLRALQLLQEVGVRTVLKANLMTFNVDYIDELIALARKVGADYQLDPTVKPRMDGDPAPLRYAVSPARIRKLILSRPDLYEAFKRFEPGELCSGDRSILKDEDVICGAARDVISLSADGGVYACGFFGTAGGHLKRQSLRDIWFGSEQFSKVRETTFGKMTACSNCEVKSTCIPCMAYAEVEHQDITQCSSSSRQMAEAIRELAESRTRVEAKLKRGKSLPLVGNINVPRPTLKDGLPPLLTE